MTNFEKILLEAPKEYMAEALSQLIVGHCDDCPALELCDSLPEEEMHIGCRGVLLRWLDQEAEPMPEAPREAGGYGGHGPVCIPGWGGNRTVYVDSHGRVHEMGCGGAGARAYDINGELVLELPE